MNQFTSPPDDCMLDRALDAALRAWQRGDAAMARQLLQRALLAAEAAHQQRTILQAHQMLGHLAMIDGDLPQARHHHRTALRGSRRAGFTLGVASSLHNLGLVAAGEGRAYRARTLVTAAVRTYTSLGYPEAAAQAYANLERLEADGLI